MTDWTAQTQKGIEQWMEAQQAWWREVLAPPAGSGQPPGAGGAGGAGAASRAIDAWRESAYRVVDAQAQLLLATLHSHHDTDPQALLRRWTDAQRTLWQDWLATAGGEAAGDQQQAGRLMVESLREAAERLVRSQAEWAKARTEAPADDRRADP